MHYHKAFTHRSAGAHGSNHKGDANNERLEFLGDAIIEAVVSDVLYHRFPDADEGFMSRLRSNMVCRARLNEISFALNLVEFIKLSSPTDLAVSHIPGDVLEAFVAAVYLDGGMKKADAFVRKHIANENRINEALGDSQQTNFKSELVSFGEQRGLEVFFETHRAEAGALLPSGESANFVSVVRLSGVECAKGLGRSKKQAEQAAAQVTLASIEEGSIDIEEILRSQMQHDEPASDSERVSEPAEGPTRVSISFKQLQDGLEAPSASRSLAVRALPSVKTVVDSSESSADNLKAKSKNDSRLDMSLTVSLIEYTYTPDAKPVNTSDPLPENLTVQYPVE